MHVRGFTASPTSGVEHPGRSPASSRRSRTSRPRRHRGRAAARVRLRRARGAPAQPGRRLAAANYWGYDPYLHFAPQASYCVDPAEGGHVDEFRDMVKALHRAGIEVILDVVFNHTARATTEGPTISFKGSRTRRTTCSPRRRRRYYMNYSGCGNTVNANHPVVEKFIGDCLAYWVREMHVDGFRFDEGSILHRGPDGAPMQYPPVVWRIELSEVLVDTKVIAEPWDAGGLYQVGQFPATRWSEWNGKFRDDVRRFIRGDFALVGAMASRIAGSADLYQAPTGCRRTASTSSPPRRLHAQRPRLVQRQAQRGERRGQPRRRRRQLQLEPRRRGPDRRPAVEAFRNRQIKNYAAILLVSQGVPMILSGDEVRRTQRGNNNTYCQDNELAGSTGRALDRHADVFRFFKELIAFRKRHEPAAPALLHRQVTPRGIPDITWHGLDVGARRGTSRGRACSPSPSAGSRRRARRPRDPEHARRQARLRAALASRAAGLDARRRHRPASPEDVAEPGTEAPSPSRSTGSGGRSVVILETDSRLGAQWTLCASPSRT